MVQSVTMRNVRFPIPPDLPRRTRRAPLLNTARPELVSLVDERLMYEIVKE